jgi:hypothetical protein
MCEHPLPLPRRLTFATRKHEETMDAIDQGEQLAEPANQAMEEATEEILADAGGDAGGE